jgi:hypothetical protein
VDRCSDLLPVFGAALQSIDPATPGVLDIEFGDFGDFDKRSALIDRADAIASAMTSRGFFATAGSFRDAVAALPLLRPPTNARRPSAAQARTARTPAKRSEFSSESQAEKEASMEHSGR